MPARVGPPGPISPDGFLATGNGPVLSSIALAGGSFANGAKSASAATIGGFAYPDRITVENDGDYVIDPAASAQIKGVTFGSDDASIILLLATGTVSLKKFNLAGAQQWTVNVATGSGLWRSGPDELLVCRNATTYHKIIESTQVVTTPTQPTGPTLLQTVPGGTADRAWQSNLSTTLTEIVISTGLASGRTITTPAAVTSMYCSNADGTPGIYVNCGSVQGILKYKESDLTLEKTWTVTTTGISAPGASVGTELFVDNTGRPWVRNQNAQAIDRFSLAQGAQLATAADRVVYGDPTLFGVGAPITGGSAQQQPFAAMSSNARYIAFLANLPDQTVTSRIVRVRNILTQTATYDVSVSSATNLRRVLAAGQLGNSYGPYSGYRTATADFRRTRMYYQRLGTDGAPVEVIPNKDLGAVALAASSTLRISVEFRMGLGFPGAPPPYIESLGLITS